MPRPKRSKVAASRNALRVAKPIIAPKAPADPIEDIYGVSDPVREPTASASPAKAPNVISETGAERVFGGTLTERGRALEHMRQKRDLAIGRLEVENYTSTAESDVPLPSMELGSSSPPIEVGRRAPADSSVFALDNVRRRARQPSILGRSRAGRSSSVESNMVGGTGLMHVPKRGSSLLPTTGLRKRSRQPSILGRAASPARSARSSSIGLQVNNKPVAGSSKVEGFYSREGRPSVSHSGRATLQDGESDFGDDQDEFDPDDESTPLNLSKKRLLAKQNSHSASPGSHPQMRRSRSGPDPSSSLPGSVKDLELTVEAIPPAGSFDEKSPQQPARLSTPEPLSDTMAPPQSSSPLPLQTSETSTRPRRQVSQNPRSRTTRQTRARVEDSPPSSPPSLTHSPNLQPVTKTASKRHNKSAPNPISFSTAQLQSLLPRRRHRIARDPLTLASDDDQAEIDTTGLGSDDDELTHLSISTGRNTRRTQAPLASTRQVTKFKTARKGKGKGYEKGERRVYGARTADSDKENVEHEEDLEEVDADHSLAPLPDAIDSPENSQELEEKVGKELKRAKRKFEDVDKWELEFEDVTASSSSPRDAR